MKSTIFAFFLSLMLAGSAYGHEGTTISDVLSQLNRIDSNVVELMGMHQSDPDPRTIDVTLGADYRSEVMTTYTPELSPGTIPKNSGVVIPNITDGFDGTGPDRGAIIDGRPTPLYGDR